MNLCLYVLLVEILLNCLALYQNYQTACLKIGIKTMVIIQQGQKYMAKLSSTVRCISYSSSKVSFRFKITEVKSPN
jgi:hypothetical protein